MTRTKLTLKTHFRSDQIFGDYVFFCFDPVMISYVFSLLFRLSVAEVLARFSLFRIHRINFTKSNIGLNDKYNDKYIIIDLFLLTV